MAPPSSGEGSVDQGSGGRFQSGPLKVFLFGVLLLVAAAAGARNMTHAVVAQLPITNEDMVRLPRLRQLRLSLPAIAARPGRQAIILGGSVAYFGFTPRFVDAELAKLGHRIESYNTATIALRPEVQLIITRRVRAEFAKRDRKLAIGMIDLAPHAMTVGTWTSDMGARLSDRGEAEFLDYQAFREIMATDPALAIRTLSTNLLGNEEPNAFTDTLAAFMYDETKPESKVVAELRSIVGQAAQPWNLAERGGVRWLYPDTWRLYQRINRNYERTKPRQRRRLIAVNDAEELHISDERIGVFVHQVREMQKTAEKTFVVILPGNRGQLRPTQQGYERVHAAIERITRETGVKFIDLWDAPGFSDEEDFIDCTHLNEHSGRPKAAKLLAAALAAELGPARNAAASPPEGGP